MACSATETDGTAEAFQSVTIDPAATYTLTGVGSGKCVQIQGASTANRAPAEIATCNNSNNQRFRIQAVSGTAGFFTLRNVSSNRCLDVENASTANGARIIQWDCHTGTNQHWRIEDVAGNAARLTLRHSNRALDVFGASTAEGATLAQWSWHGGSNQQFSINVTGGGGGGTGGGGTGGGGTGGGGTGGGGTGGGGTGGGGTGGGGAATAGSGACVENIRCKLDPPPATGDRAQDCVDRINQFRTQCACLPPLERWTAGEACANQHAEYDSTRSAHSGFSDRICQNGGSAQNECPGWRSPAQVVGGCLQLMWDEGPPPQNPCQGQCFQDHGHFINMTGTRYRRVACGFFQTAAGQWWAVQNFSN